MFTKISKKIIIPVIVLLVLLLASLVYFFFLRNDEGFSLTFKGTGILGDVDFAKLYSVSDISLSDGETVWLFGEYKGLDIRTNSVEVFELKEGKEIVNINVELIEKSTTIPEDSYLLLIGFYDTDDYLTFVASSFELIDEETYEELYFRKFPAVELEILNKDLSLKHGCENANVMVKIRNVGDIPIAYDKTGVKNPEYLFMSVIDDEIYSLYPDSGFNSSEGDPLGYIYGLRNFDVLEPGDEKTVRFGLGGQVQFGENGAGGTNNIFCDKRGEELRIQFGSIKKIDSGSKIDIDYDFTNVYSSNKIPVSVDTCRCILDAESLPKPL